jgi:hypothetical protein
MLILFTIIALLLTGESCKKDPVGPIVSPTDSTSHNFVVTRIDTLGDLFSSAYGVDIVDENNIWVVGEFTVRDSNNSFNRRHNLAHWNGVKWEMIAVPMYGYNNTGPSPQILRAIKVFNDSNIFVISDANSHARWDGHKWSSYYVGGVGILQFMWARSPNDIYFCGELGSATHWNGQTFTKMTTGITKPPLTDVWGDDNEVFATGHSIFTEDGTDHVLLYSNNTTSWIISQKYTPTFENAGSMLSIYRADSHSKLWMLGGHNSGSVWEITSLSPFVAKEVFNINNLTLMFIPYIIRGNADNDLFVVGAINGELFHFNGNTWKRLEPPLSGYSTSSFSVKNNVYLIAGDTFDRAIVMMGVRN